MTLDEIKKIERNFNEIDWECDRRNHTAIYENDVSLSLRVNKEERDFDKYGEGYDELLKLYDIQKFASAEFCYNGIKVHSINLLCPNNASFFIPVPIGVNLPDTFYENEVKLAKVLSEEYYDCDRFFKDKKLMTRSSKKYSK